MNTPLPSTALCHQTTIPFTNDGSGFETALDVLRKSPQGVMSIDCFAPPSQLEEVRDVLVASGLDAPGMFVHSLDGAEGGMQITTCPAHLQAVPIFDRQRLVGHVLEDAQVRYCLLSGLVPEDRTASPEVQTEDIFRMAERALASVGMDFRNVARTWFYNDRILDWYDGFNRVRTSYFRAHGISVLPASTGIGAANSTGSALVVKILAVDPRGAFRALPSPLQCEATDYGSSFSRAIEIASPNGRAISVSGTASIEPGGKTIFPDDPLSQIETTMEVVSALLEAAGSSLGETTRAIAYFRDPSHIEFWKRHARSRSLEDLPILLTACTVCRDDLLFEIELDVAGHA